MNGYVYVMAVPDKPLLCKVGRTRQKSIKDRFPDMRHGGESLAFFNWHAFEDSITAEREVHSQLAWCRRGREEFFEIEPVGAWGAVLWYAGEIVLRPVKPRRALRVYRSWERSVAETRKYNDPTMQDICGSSYI